MPKFNKRHGTYISYSPNMESESVYSVEFSDTDTESFLLPQDVSEFANDFVGKAESEFKSWENNDDNLSAKEGVLTFVDDGVQEFECNMNINNHSKNIELVSIVMERLMRKIISEKIKFILSKDKISKREFKSLIDFAISEDESFVYNSFPKGSILVSTIDRWSTGQSAPINSQRALFASKLLEYIESKEG